MVEPAAVIEMAKAEYKAVTPQIRLLPYIGDTPEVINANNLDVVADASDPLSFHGCFKTPLTYGLLTETYQTHEAPTPKSENLSYSTCSNTFFATSCFKLPNFIILSIFSNLLTMKL